MARVIIQIDNYFQILFVNLFKDSTVGLVARNEPDLGSHVEDYKKLFRNLEECIQNGATEALNASKWTLMVAIAAIIYIAY